MSTPELTAEQSQQVSAALNPHLGLFFSQSNVTAVTANFVTPPERDGPVPGILVFVAGEPIPDQFPAELGGFPVVVQHGVLEYH